MKKIEKPARAKKALASATSASILGTGAVKPKGKSAGPVKSQGGMGQVSSSI